MTARPDAATLRVQLADPDPGVRLAAIVAAAGSGVLSLAPAVAARLEAPSEAERMQAAIALGYLGATEYAPALVARLPAEQDLTFAGLVGAIELLRNRAVLPALLEQLRGADGPRIWDLAHALSTLSGVQVAVKPRAAPDRLRAAWLQAARDGALDAVPAPRVSAVRREAHRLVSFDVQYGRGTIGIDFDPPKPGSAWPRWGRSLRVRGKPVLDVGSTCGTCETLLRFLSWPDEDVSALAGALEDRRGRLRLAEAVEAWAPLLGELNAGGYLASELGFPVEVIDPARAAASWFVRRDELRTEEDGGTPSDRESTEDAGRCPQVAHYQGPRLLDPATYPVVLPLGDPARLDQATVADFRARIEAGERPMVVALAWLDARCVEARWPERFLCLAVLNGHHRLEAYARAGVPARFIALARVDDSWGPPENPARFLRETFGRLAAWP